MALSQIQQVRLAIGDRDTPPILSDEEIQHFLDTGGSVDAAIGQSAKALSMYFATKANQTTGRMSVSYSDRAKVYADLALRYGADIVVAPPYVGGISKSELEQSSQEPDLVQPAFTRDLHDNPRKGAVDGELP